MPLSKEVRLLQNKWATGNSWPKRLEWLEISGIRGWNGQRVDFGFDLSRIQPVSARVGYSRLAKRKIKEKSSVLFQPEKLTRWSSIMGISYGLARMSVTEYDAKRQVPVIKTQGGEYSGFHGGAGETTIVEFLGQKIPKYSLLVVDEIETSLHPRAQRRLIRDLAEICRVQEIQGILSTHSPYVLEELPPEARLYIWEGTAGRSVIKGVSPEFAMTRMDLEQHPECDVYVEDDRAETWIREIIVKASPELISRCLIIPFGAASVGQSLGSMVAAKRFPRPSCVCLDGDQPPWTGCLSLPGGDAPERSAGPG